MKTKELAVYFLLAYLISWVIWSPYWLPSFGFNTHPILPYQHGIGGFGPMLSAFITTAIFGGRADVRKLWRSLTAWRPLSWLLIAILTPPALALLGGLVAFPSIHMVMALMVAWYSRGTWAFFAFCVSSLLMIPATLLHGGHHLSDLFGGLALFALAVSLARWLVRDPKVVLQVPSAQAAIT